MSYMFQDNIVIKWHLQSEALRSIRERVLLDSKTSSIAFLHCEYTSGEGDVLKLHIMKKCAHMDNEKSVLWDCIWTEQSTKITHFQSSNSHYIPVGGALTFNREWSSGHQRGGDREQNLVFCIVLGVRPPQYLQHGLHTVGDVVLVIWGMALK